MQPKNQNVCFACIYKIIIISRSFPFLGQVIHNIENGQTEVRFAGSVWTIDYAVFDDPIFDSKLVKLIVAGLRQVPFYPIGFK